MHAPHWVFQAKHVRFSCITFLTCDSREPRERGVLALAAKRSRLFPDDVRARALPVPF